MADLLKNILYNWKAVNKYDYMFDACIDFLQSI